MFYPSPIATRSMSEQPVMKRSRSSSPFSRSPSPFSRLLLESSTTLASQYPRVNGYEASSKGFAFQEANPIPSLEHTEQPTLYRAMREDSIIKDQPVTTENPVQKGMGTLSSVCDRSDSFTGRPRFKWYGDHVRRGPIRVSNSEVERLLGVGYEFERKIMEKKRRRLRLEGICEKFRKDIMEHVYYQVNCSEEVRVCGSMPAMSEDLLAFGLKVDLILKDGKVAMNVKFDTAVDVILL